MLDFLRAWVQHIVMIIVLAGFIEMILPNGNIRKFVQVVVGLFLIMAILNPALQLLRQDVTWHSPPWTQDVVAQEDVTGIIRQGQDLAGTAQEQAFYHYRRQLEEQVASLVRAVEGVGKVKTELAVVENPDSEEYGGLRGLTVWVGMGDSQEEVVPVVQPVEINLGDDGDKKPGEESTGKVPSPVVKEIIRVLTTFYNLEGDSITVLDLNDRK